MTATTEQTSVSRSQIGERIRELREERSITQERLASVLGLTKSSVSRIESGERGLAAVELAALADDLGVTADYLLFGEREGEFMLRADGETAGVEDAQRFAREIAQDIEFVEALLG
ncbi:MAG TPA: helix-turn-helix transcriptional regulator [Solirubrobacteraceae bacterium]|nr:helix-turn-helix transcriptional regulator [Solirubrobacteraceae bacterium]